MKYPAPIVMFGLGGCLLLFAVFFGFVGEAIAKRWPRRAGAALMPAALCGLLCLLCFAYTTLYAFVFLLKELF